MFQANSGKLYSLQSGQTELAGAHAVAASTTRTAITTICAALHVKSTSAIFAWSCSLVVVQVVGTLDQKLASSTVIDTQASAGQRCMQRMQATPQADGSGKKHAMHSESFSQRYSWSADMVFASAPGICAICRHHKWQTIVYRCSVLPCCVQVLAQLQSVKARTAAFCLKTFRGS